MEHLSRACGLCLGLLVTTASAAEEAAVARAHLRGAEPAGAVFFLSVPAAPDAVAVGAAHSFDRTQLAESGELEFRVGGGREPVAVSSRYYAKPGRAYHKPGATLRDDFVLFALTERPQGVRILEPAAELPRNGDRVRILGIPSQERAAQAQILGSVVRSGRTEIEVALDAPADLRGWGGAPVLEADGGRVVGLLQSAWPSGKGMRTGVGPIGGVVEALSRPLEGGLGRLFAAFAPVPSAATGHAARRRDATGSPFGDQAPGRSAAEVIAAALREERTAQPLAPASVLLQIEQPPRDAVVGDAAGVFVAGRALALRGEARRFDIVIVIDTSESTSQPAGVDVDGDGVLGLPRPGAMPGSREPRSTDPGDSILAAEVAAAKRLLAGLDPRSTRVGLVTFAGEPARAGPPGPAGLEVRRAALTEEPLTSDFRRLRRALDLIHERGASGMTHMAAGVDQATLELLGLPGSISRPDPGSEKVVLFFTDGEPTLPHPNYEAGNVAAVLQSAVRARRVGAKIHSFAIGPEALAGPISTVEMASISKGVFTPVRHPGSLIRFIELVSFANIAEVEIVNTTTRASPYPARVHADGSWDALVPLATGENQLEVRARSSDGAEATARATVSYVPRSASPPLPAELVPKHNELLEKRLEELSQERLEALRKELVLEIERERAAAVERAARQRKELTIEVERPGSAPPAFEGAPSPPNVYTSPDIRDGR